ncbi:hypothetical protein HJC23_004513 [Cyclotella cryptica]|uniref:Uncharacterized protein n=1 Tax=Cyclotella cryptica TaxID=29204 RepID=A0ABD3NZC5_9STRA
MTFIVSPIEFASHRCCALILLFLVVPNVSAFTRPIPAFRQNESNYLWRKRYHTQPQLHSASNSHSDAKDAQSRLLEKATPSHDAQPQIHPDPLNLSQKYLSSATPYNKDIARTLFPHLFFSLHHYQNNATNREQRGPSIDSNMCRYPTRPSPFNDPTSAQTSERMLRRMMENRYQSDGRTACPDAKTFELVAGAFGRLRYQNSPREAAMHVNVQRHGEIFMPVTWAEEPKINPHHRSNMEDGWNYKQIVFSNHTARSAMEKVVMTPQIKLQEIAQMQLQLCHYEGWPQELCPSVEVYNRILKRLGTDNTLMPGDAEAAWRIFQLMQSPLPRAKANCMVCAPNAMTCCHVIRVLSLHRPVAAVGSTANVHSSNKRFSTPPAMLQSWEELCNELNIETSNSVIPRNASTDWFLEEAEKVVDILKRHLSDMPTTLREDCCRDDVTNILSRSISCLLEGWGKFAVTCSVEQSDASNSDNTCDKNGSLRKHSLEHREKAINRAQELLCFLEELSDGEDKSVHIPSSSHASVILALSVSNHPSAAYRAEQILRRMIEKYKTLANFDPKDISTAFSACIAAYTKNNDAPKAESILYQMIDLYDSSVLGDEFVPDSRAYGTCIAAWAKYDPAITGLKMNGRAPFSRPLSRQQRIQNADRAEAILAELERLAERETAKGNREFQLHATSYNIVIHARVQTVHSSSRKEYSNKNDFFDNDASNEQAIFRAMSLLNHMEYDMHVTPDSFTYSILLNAWVQHSRPGNEIAADRAEELLRRKIQSSDVDTPCCCDSEEGCWPNVKHYSAVLKAHAKTKSAGGAKKALALLSEMETFYANANVIPNDVKECYDEDTATKYHIETREAAKPDLICYGIVMDAFANSRLPEAGAISYRLLGALESKYESGDFSMKPNTRIYTAVIQSLIHSQFVGSIGDLKDAPAHRWINNAQVAMHILERMKNNNVSPNSFTYNYIINCAAECKSDKSSEARASFEVAVRAFQELRCLGCDNEAENMHRDACPDSFTYAFMMKACNNLLPIGSSLHTKTLTHTFRECCRRGYLNNAVLDRLYNGLSCEKHFFEIIGTSPSQSSSGRRKEFSFDIQDLPQSWSRNVKKNEDRSSVTDKTLKWNKGVELVSLPNRSFS